jgi:hypothetical protein
LTRRALLSLFGSAAAAAVTDPDRLLWVPGKKKIFIPSPTVTYIEVWKQHAMYWVDGRGMVYRSESLHFHPVSFVLTYPELAAKVEG